MHRATIGGVRSCPTASGSVAALLVRYRSTNLHLSVERYAAPSTARISSRRRHQMSERPRPAVEQRRAPTADHVVRRSTSPSLPGRRYSGGRLLRSAVGTSNRLQFDRDRPCHGRQWKAGGHIQPLTEPLQRRRPPSTARLGRASNLRSADAKVIAGRTHRLRAREKVMLNGGRTPAAGLIVIAGALALPWWVAKHQSHRRPRRPAPNRPEPGAQPRSRRGFRRLVRRLSRSSGHPDRLGP